MVLSGSAMSLLDEAAIYGAEDHLRVTRSRYQRDAAYAADFRFAILELVHKLWPPGIGRDVKSYMSAIDLDLELVPLDLLEDLVHALIRLSKQRKATDPALGAACDHLAKCLKMRIVELRSPSPASLKARNVKYAYKQFIRDLVRSTTTSDSQAVA